MDRASKYLLIESRDPFESRDCAFLSELAVDLRAGVEVLADEFSLRERGIRLDRLTAGRSPCPARSGRRSPGGGPQGPVALMRKTLTLVLMDPPYENPRTTTALPNLTLHVSAQGYTLQVLHRGGCAGAPPPLSPHCTTPFTLQVVHP